VSPVEGFELLQEDDVSEEAMEFVLADALLQVDEDYGAIESIRTFADSGLMTSNRGIVVKVGGKKFQITIVQS